ncbi:hypothetical protein V6N12_069475 [Hibiscus sabdariffa]|uniref:Uncharacterized protein n=1 Tax=Hibiscus sabdariffa TaxID=183260 RepID=A0ABR2FE14_9ROSI
MRFGNCQEASRAVGRLNGFNQYKFQLNVAFATGKRKANHVVESVQKVWVPQRNTDGVKVKTGNDTTEELIQRGWVTDQGHEVNNKSESSSEVAKKPLPVMSVRKKNKACNTECFGFNSIDEVLGDMAYINPSFMRVAVDDKNMRLSPLVSYFDSSPEVSLAKEKSDGHEELNIESGPPRKEDKKFEEPGFDKPGSEQSSSDNEEFDSFFHEMGSIRLHKKGKKYVLMMEFEEKALTEVERKKTK